MPLLAAASSPLCFFSSSVFLSSPLRIPSSKTHPRSALSSLRIRSELATAAATLPVFSFSGEKTSTAILSLKSAPPSTARAVVHRGLITDQRNARRGTASTLTRAEVRGGGKKPFQQKKTGRARRGSQRTPLRPGGGVVFGPKPKDWSIKINRKEKRLSMSTAIASAAASADAFVVEEFDEEFEKGPKTKEFIAAMKRWGLDPREKATFLMTEVTDNMLRSCRNIGTLKILTPRTLNLFDILDAEKLVFTKSAVEYLNAMYGDDAGWEEVQDDEVIEVFKETSRQGKKGDMEGKHDVYHEKQRLQFCLLHALNNLVQEKCSFTQAELDAIADKLVLDNPGRDRWTPLSLVWKPHYNVLTGNYDVNVLIAALEARSHRVVWHDRRNGASSINLTDESVPGIVLNIPVRKLAGLWRGRHWVTVRRIAGVWYNLDSEHTGNSCLRHDRLRWSWGSLAN